MAVVINGTTGIDKVQDGSIGTVDIAADAITPAKIDNSVILGRRNLIINGDMRIAQRGTGAFTANSSFPVDRWNIISNATDFTTTQDSAVPTGKGFTNSIKIQPTATKSPSASTYSRIGYSIEGYDGVSLCWGTSGAKTATISFWVKSSVTGTYSICVKNGAANKSVVQDYTISVADTWEYKTITIPPETSGTWDSVNGRFAYIDIWLAGQGSQTSTTGSWISSNANMSNNQVNFFSSTSNTFNITGFQFEVGSVATPFEHRSFDEELAACQRYYEIIGNWASTSQFYAFPIFKSRSASIGIPVHFRVQKRAIPTITSYDRLGTTTGVFTQISNGTNLAIQFGPSSDVNGVYRTQHATQPVAVTESAYGLKITVDAEL